MRPSWRQALTAWSIIAGASSVGVTLWIVGLATYPRATLVVVTFLVLVVVQMYRGVRKYDRTWPDVTDEQMREVECQREEEKTRC